MKTFSKKLLAIAIVAVVTTITATAQLRLGVKAAVGINNIKWDNEIIDHVKKNMVGYSVGVTSEFSVPIVGLGVEASALYTHRRAELTDNNTGFTYKRDYIEIPVHAKYKLQLPALSNVVTPFAFAGPNFAFLARSSDDKDAFKDRTMAISLDLGAGAEIMKHLQLSVSYSLGMNKAFEYVGVNDKTTNIAGKDKCWTISAAYLF